jgi:hypothetical protein
MVHDAQKLPGLSAEQRQQLREELRREGSSAPHWLLELLAGR